MKWVKLSNGIQIPAIGYGTFQIKPEHAKQWVLQALQAGYRLIDTAASYFNEKEIGEAIRQSGIPRNEIFLTTKVWIQDAGYEKTLAAFEKSLERLQTDYIDLYLIHQPYGDYYGSWKAMEKLSGGHERHLHGQEPGDRPGGGAGADDPDPVPEG